MTTTGQELRRRQMSMGSALWNIRRVARRAIGKVVENVQNG